MLLTAERFLVLFTSLNIKINLINRDIIILGDFLLDILLTYSYFLRTFEFSDFKEDVARIKFNETNFDFIKNNFIVEPEVLLMFIQKYKLYKDVYR